MSDRFGYGEIGLGIESGENDKQTTNADRLRAMTDEELSVFLETATESERVSETEWLKWLKGAAQI